MRRCERKKREMVRHGRALRVAELRPRHRELDDDVRLLGEERVAEGAGGGVGQPGGRNGRGRAREEARGRGRGEEWEGDGREGAGRVRPG